jgi:hypothetical protein
MLITLHTEKVQIFCFHLLEEILQRLINNFNEASLLIINIQIKKLNNMPPPNIPN